MFDSSCSYSNSIRYSTLITLTRGEINLDAEEIKETKLIIQSKNMNIYDYMGNRGKYPFY